MDAIENAKLTVSKQWREIPTKNKRVINQMICNVNLQTSYRLFSGGQQSGEWQTAVW